MQNEWSAWLAAEKAAGRGGIAWPEPIVRGLPFEMALNIPFDVSTADFAASLRLSPDAAGAALADFTVDVGDFADGVTPVTFALTDTQTNGLPADANGDGLVALAMDALYLPAVGNPRRSFALALLVSGRVTEVPA